eukprot:COSAG06_NODE_30040_length_545_cov_16.181614_1_plen_42_part_10
MAHNESKAGLALAVNAERARTAERARGTIFNKGFILVFVNHV